MKKNLKLINVYEDGWTIQYSLDGLWIVVKDHKTVSHAFSVYEDAVAHMRKLQEEERCRQLKASSLAQGA